MNGFYSPFPPNFTDGPASYALALFGDLFACGLSLMVLLYHTFEVRRLTQAHSIAERRGIISLPAKKRSWRSLVHANDYMIMGFALMVFLRTLPDSIWMTVWGEASFSTMRMLFLVDYILDFLALIPLAAGVVLWAFARQSIAQQLAKAGDHLLPKPTLVKLSGILRVGGLVALISVGLTFAKAASA